MISKSVIKLILNTYIKREFIREKEAGKVSKLIKRLLVPEVYCGWAGDNQPRQRREREREREQAKKREREQGRERMGPRFGKNQITPPANIGLVSMGNL